jgi:hypothetical protein
MNVGGQTSPFGPHVDGGGKHMFWLMQHWPLTHMMPIGQAAPPPQPLGVIGTQRPFTHCEPVGQLEPSGPQAVALHMPATQAAPGGHGIVQPPTGTQAPF